MGNLSRPIGQNFAALCLFVETMPIYKAVAKETEIMSCAEKRQVQTGKNPITLNRHNASL